MKKPRSASQAPRMPALLWIGEPSPEVEKPGVGRAVRRQREQGEEPDDGADQEAELLAPVRRRMNGGVSRGREIGAFAAQ